MSFDIPLFKMYWDEDDINAVSSVIRRGTYWAMGPEIQDFEREIAEYIGTKYAVVFNSGTSALHAVLLACDIKPKDEVIVPSLTFISTVNTVLFTNGKPVFADIENKTYALNADDVKEKITAKTRVIMPVHYGGCPAYDIKKLREIADDHDLILIEDAAAAFGASIKNQKIGTFGDAAMFSFCQNKIITTGEGGVVVTDSKDIYKKLKLIVSHGKKNNDYVCIGYNFRMPSINAALGISQLKKVDKLISMRQSVADKYNKKLKGIRSIHPFLPPEGFRHVYWIYSIIVDENMRDDLQRYLLENKIYCKLYYEPVHLTSLYKSLFGCKKGLLPNTEDFCDKSLSLPMFPHLQEEEIDYIVQCVRNKMG